MTGFVNFLIGALSAVCFSGACLAGLGKALSDKKSPKNFDVCVKNYVPASSEESGKPAQSNCFKAVVGNNGGEDTASNGGGGGGTGTNGGTVEKIAKFFDFLFDTTMGLSEAVRSAKLEPEAETDEESE